MELSRAARLLPPPVRRAARRQLVRVRSRGLRHEDALLVSYPKSGSTWLRFLLAHALTEREADFDSIRDTLAPVGRHRRAPALLTSGGRLLRSHEPMRPYHGRPGQPVIYLVRDGRDVALSYLDHQRRYGAFHGGIGEFVERFLTGTVDNYGPWHEHVLGAVDFGRGRATPFLLVRYEDLRADPVAELARVLDFLGADRDRDALAGVVAANDKERMRAKEAKSAFLTSMSTDGSPLVRPDRKQGWSEMVPVAAQARFQAVCGPALAAAGYDQDLPVRSAKPQEGG